jgi:hypothetical protein
MGNLKGTNLHFPRDHDIERFLLTFFHHRHFLPDLQSSANLGLPARTCPPFPAFHRKALPHSSFTRRPVHRILRITCQSASPSQLMHTMAPSSRHFGRETKLITPLRIYIPYAGSGGLGKHGILQKRRSGPVPDVG